ncbi:MAG: hypothetical protein A2X94_00810 [Bdellovibrionales bacterium GWB1_55_8]|nr:MAG: hypothetical protein A2X94_00810 [Bdellovibrionales bacterium GWB1_55_8]
MTFQNFINRKLSDLAYKIDGLGLLFLGYKSTGSRDRDAEAMTGVGTLLESLADEGKRIANLVDLASLSKIDVNLPLEVEFGKYEHDEIGRVEAFLDSKRNALRIS